MTFLLKDIADQLRTSSAVTNAFSDHIYPDFAPQHAAFPYITLGVITTDPTFYLRGEAGKHTTRVQIDVYTDGTGGSQKINELTELVRNRLSGYRGQFGTGCYGTARMTGNNSNALAPVDASDNRIRHASMDFEFIHAADVPAFT